MTRRYTLTALLMSLGMTAFGQTPEYYQQKFKQLYEELPTPNTYRTASGAPGHEYWQQRADYNIQVELDDQKRSISGTETITYFNNSPDALTYLWVQLDQNQMAKDSDTYKTRTGTLNDQMNLGGLAFVGATTPDFEGGYKIKSVTDAAGKPLPYTINKTMMRVDLPKPLAKGQSFAFNVAWSYNINDRMKLGGRSGYEYFAEDDNCLYTIAQFFPRMAVYDDVNGWQHKQFLGTGEFTLPFGNYTVRITVPSDHMMGATGVLQNPADVLSKTELERWEKAKKTFDKPVIIRTQDEAKEKEKAKATDKKTWVFKAENVRDFAFATSRKFIWDAMAVRIGSRDVMAMSYYPKEGNPLWEKYSTEAVAHTLKVYSKYTIDYPYPVAISVHADQIGMEYPMICFNFGRPEKDGTYSARTKYGMLGVIIHEVGHNFFPMIINSDERQWTWMDEGLNSFVEYLAEQEWEPGFPSRRGPAYNMVPYMKSDRTKQVPIMTNSESIQDLGNNSYGKPATALNILRETVMGRELFDYAFKEYCRRWAFKHPSPADFFRTMEDASGVDLDWFWKGWFYTNDPVDISIDAVEEFVVDSRNPDVEKARQKAERDRQTDITNERNKNMKTRVDERPELKDFYNTYDPLNVTKTDREQYNQYLKGLGDEERKFLDSGKGKFFYEIKFKNVGGLVMPIILQMEMEDGSKVIERIPAEIWRYNSQEVTKVFATDKKVKAFLLDPSRETADIDEYNNSFPRQAIPTRFQVFKQRIPANENPMQQEIRENGSK